MNNITQKHIEKMRHRIDQEYHFHNMMQMCLDRMKVDSYIDMYIYYKFGIKATIDWTYSRK